MWRTTPGNETGECVGVNGGGTDYRSGDFIVGNVAAFLDDWNGTYENSKLYYVPLHPKNSRPPLTVSVLHYGDTADKALRDTFGEYAWTTTGVMFYVTGTVLPRPGRWRIGAWAGSDFGWFDVTVG